MPDPLIAKEIRARLTTRVAGRYLELYDSIDSTNRRATELARSGAPDGALVLAEVQTQGRGRLGRRWYAPAGSSLLMSLILRPPLPPTRAQRAVMVCALGLIEAIRAAGLPAGLKWPNDILVDGQKTAGILAELGVRAQALDYVVVGMGLNVNLDVSALPEQQSPATSLSAQAGHPLPRLELLLDILTRIDVHYAALCAGTSPLPAWRQHLLTLGQRVSVGTPDEVIDGLVVDATEDGALVLQTADGAYRTILVGDVTLRGHRIGATPEPTG